MTPTTVHAAGTVLWRTLGPTPAKSPGEGQNAAVEIALVHRPKYDDWSLPKGKLAAGEHPAVAACRETLEETGHQGPLGRSLGRLSYPVVTAAGTADKLVDFWAMQASDGTFEPSDEVDRITWLAPDKALETLTRADEAAPVRRLLGAPLATTSVLLVRHARAGDRRSWKGPDDARPLDEVGREQAEQIAAVLPCFGVSAVFSADIVRCVETVTPLAVRLGVAVAPEPALSWSHHEKHPGAAAKLVLDLAAAERHVAACSQDGVIPDAVAELSAVSGVTPDEGRTRKGSVWVLSFAGRILVAAHYLDDLAPSA